MSTPTPDPDTVRKRRTVWMTDLEWRAVQWAAQALERNTGEPCSAGDYIRRAVRESIRGR